MLIEITVIILGLTLAGVAAIVFGCRGRRIDDHPLCRRCRYDLSGIGENPERCPECGRDLRSASRGIRTGNRRRRRWAIASGIALILLAVGVGATLWTAEANRFNWYPYKPFWLLTRGVTSADADTASASREEVMRRLREGHLSRDQIQRYADTILKIQSDPDQPWFIMYGDFVETAWQSGHIGDETIAEYLRTAVAAALSFTTRDRLYRDSEITWLLERGRMRVGESDLFAAYTTDFSLKADGVVLADRGGGRFSVRPSSSGAGGSWMPHGLDLGEHQIVCEATVFVGLDVEDETPRASAPTSPAERRDEIMARMREARSNREQEEQRLRENAIVAVELRFEKTLTIVPDDVQIVATFEDETVRDQIRQAVIHQPHPTTSTEDGTRIRYGCLMMKAPISVSFDVFVRTNDGREWLVNAIVGEQGRTARAARAAASISRALHADFPADEHIVDVILRANPHWAIENPRIDEVWRGEIVFENVDLDARASSASAPR